MSRSMVRSRKSGLKPSGKSCRMCGRVNLDSKSTNFDALYSKFVSWNGDRFTFDDFKYITMMNNRADELANMGISHIKGEM